MQHAKTTYPTLYNVAKGLSRILLQATVSLPNVQQKEEARCWTAKYSFL